MIPSSETSIVFLASHSQMEIDNPVRASQHRVIFDENSQRIVKITKTPELKSADVGAAEPIASQVVYNTEYAHGCVSTCNVRVVGYMSAASDSAWQNEQCVWAPVQVEGADHVTIGKVVVQNLCATFGVDSLDALFLKLCKMANFVLFVLSEDQASANGVFNRKFVSALNSHGLLSGDQSAAASLAVWVEYCMPHRTNRILVKLTKRLKCQRLLWVVQDFVRRRRFKKQLKAKCIQYIGDTFEFNELPPPYDPEMQSRRATIKRVMRKPVVGDPDAKTKDDHRFEAMHNYLYDNRDPFSKRLGHICSDRCRTSDR